MHTCFFCALWMVVIWLSKVQVVMYRHGLELRADLSCFIHKIHFRWLRAVSMESLAL
jgi:hypothetical protein